MADSRDINPISPGERTTKSVTPKSENTIFSEDVGPAFQRDSNAKSNLTKVMYGYVADSDEVPEAYKIKITSRRLNAGVIGLLQDDLQIKVGSQWSPIVPTNALAFGNIATQVITRGQTSFITKASSRRSWVGSTPIIMGLSLRFEAVNDAHKEVLEPCRILQSLALPSEPSSDTANPNSKDLLLSPPGPSPFILDFLGKYKRSNGFVSQLYDYFSESRNQEYIIVEIGNLISFWNVIVSEVQVSVPPKFTREGDPISATVNMIFETYEMPTVESLKLSYQRASLTGGVE